MNFFLKQVMLLVLLFAFTAPPFMNPESNYNSGLFPFFSLSSYAHAQESANLGIFDATADWGLEPEFPPKLGQHKIPGRVEINRDENGDYVYGLFGNGDDLLRESDEGFFVYTIKEGDIRFSAKVIWVDNGGHPKAKIGLMIRKNAIETDSIFYAVMLQSGEGDRLGNIFEATWRRSDKYIAQDTRPWKHIINEDSSNTPKQGTPFYMRVTYYRSNNLFISEWSYDGTEWNHGHSMVIDVGENPAYGLAICNHSDNELLAHARISEIKLEKVSQPFSATGSLAILLYAIAVITIVFTLWYFIQSRKKIQQLVEKEMQFLLDHEQERIGHELHDGVIQQLTSAKMIGEAIVNDMQEKISNQQYVKRLNEMLLKSIHELRALSKGLYPVELHKQGLCKALEALVSTQNEIGKIPCTLEIDRDITIQDEITCINVYRIVQEAINNASKHSQAKQITIRFHRYNDSYIAQVIDDGIGFYQETTSSSSKSGMGLSIMKYRADRINAKLSIQCQPGAGTVVECKVPVTKQ